MTFILTCVTTIKIYVSNFLAEKFGYRFSCPAVRLAYRNFLREKNKEVEHFELFANALSDYTRAKGYLLEMFFLFKCDTMALVSSKDEAAYLRFNGKSFVNGEPDREFNIKYRKILRDVDLYHSDDKVWQKGNLLVLESNRIESNRFFTKILIYNNLNLIISK